jgi:hypothetical protein
MYFCGFSLRRVGAAAGIITIITPRIGRSVILIHLHWSSAEAWKKVASF